MAFEEACSILDRHFEVDPGVIEEWVRSKIGGFKMVGTIVSAESDDWALTAGESGMKLFRERRKERSIPPILFHIRESLAVVFDVRKALSEGIMWESASDEVRDLYRKKDQFEITVS